MKWLYRILRLFFCPHRWELDSRRNGTNYYANFDDPMPVRTVRPFQCRYCGKTREMP